MADQIIDFGYFFVGIDVFHPVTDFLIGDLLRSDREMDQEVEVVPHQAIGKDFQAREGLMLPDESQKVFLLVLLHDDSPVHDPADDMEALGLVF